MAVVTETDRPTKRWSFRGVLDTAMREIFRHLAKVALGPFRILFSDDYDSLYLQVLSQEGVWSSVVRVDRDGKVDATGAVTASQTLENPGRG